MTGQHEHNHVQEVEEKAANAVVGLVAIAWTIGVAVLAVTVLRPSLTEKLPVVGSLVRDNTTWAVIFAVVGVLIGVLTFLVGDRRIGVAVAVLCGIATVVVTAPVVEMASIANDHGASLNYVENLTPSSTSGQSDPARSVTYNTVDGTELKLDVWVPGQATAAPSPGPLPDDTPKPAVVRVHGGGWVTGQRGQTPVWNEWLNEHGYAVFDIDYRLATNGPTWDQAAGDVLCAVGWVKAHATDYRIDPNRISLLGESAGGQLALQAAYGTGGAPTTPSCPVADPSVRAVVALYPASDLAPLWQADPADGLMRPWLQSFQGGTPDAVPAHYTASSPVDNVKAGLAPTLLLHGEEDTVIPVDQTQTLTPVLDGAGVTVEEITLPLEEHAFDRSWSSLGTQVARQAAVTFLDAHSH